MNFRIAAVLIAAAAAGIAQEKPAPKHPAEIEKLVDRARAAPPEFAADALIRIAASDKVDREWKRELLEDAFHRAGSAQQPVRKRAVVRNGASVFADKAFAQQLDTLSLQSRAVRAMLAVDPRKARELFAEIPVPEPPPSNCESALVYDVSAYYDALGEVHNRAFTAAEIAKDEPLHFVQERMRLTSPVQIGPMARMLASLKSARDQLEPLAMTFSGTLKELAGDDRSYAFSVSHAGGAGEGVAALEAALKKSGASPVPLADAYRTFLVRQLGGERCADGAPEQPVMAFGMRTPEQQMDPVQFFNSTIRVEPLADIGDIEPSKVEGTVKTVKMCDSQECGELVKQYRGLVLGPNGLPYGPEMKTTSEWQGQLKEHLASLAKWKADAAGQFLEKCELYTNLMTVVPNGSDRETVLRQFLEFLKQNSYRQQNRIEWFLPANSLVARVYLEPVQLGQLMRELRGCEDAVIALYASLEDFAPRSPGESLSIF